jgi:NNP family nitrate/nitrite transporter-like MFS transporter
LGYFKQTSGSYQTGLLIFAGLAVLAMIGLAGVKNRWRTTWGTTTTAKV